MGTSFGHHPLRIGLPCTGSGQSVRHHVAAHPEAKLVLAVFDPAVPPVGQFAIYRSIPEPRKLAHTRHTDQRIRPQPLQHVHMLR